MKSCDLQDLPSGGQLRFSYAAIEIALALRLIFHLPLRQTDGFGQAILAVTRAGLDAQDHAALSRQSRGRAPR